ncbi:MAG: NnrU family protein [Candidatus Caenarcaniphilales bacterium]|nr:NnrU family protein [Candidatus Caenarcaniphilales bacterium]
MLAFFERLDSHIVVILFALFFGIAHSGMAALRPALERYLPPRVYRWIFVLVSFGIAIPWLIYLVNHRYDGIVFFDWHESDFAHLIVFVLSTLAFFFLYPGTFHFLEILTIKKPKQRFHTTGIIRITRHPQLTGMSLWCLAHFLWIGTSFMLATAFGLIGYHLFAAWHGDRRRLKLFGKDYQEQVLNCTSILPFEAILAGKQKIYWREFRDWAYFWIIIFVVTVYALHPLIYENFPNWYF